MLQKWWKLIPTKVRGASRKERTDLKHRSTASDNEVSTSPIAPDDSPLAIEDELSEILPRSASFNLSGSSVEDDGEDDSLTATETEHDEESVISVFVGKPPSVIIIAVMMSSYPNDDDDEGLPPASTISVLQQLFAGLDDEFDAENELMMETRTVVSALTGVLTN